MNQLKSPKIFADVHSFILKKIVFENLRIKMSLDFQNFRKIQAHLGILKIRFLNIKLAYFHDVYGLNVSL